MQKQGLKYLWTQGVNWKGDIQFTFVSIEIISFCLTHDLTNVHFWSELKHVGYVRFSHLGWQQTRSGPIRAKDWSQSAPLTICKLYSQTVPAALSQIILIWPIIQITSKFQTFLILHYFFNSHIFVNKVPPVLFKLYIIF